MGACAVLGGWEQLGFYGPKLSRYRLCLAHPAALARGFTIIFPVSVLVYPASPLPLYPYSSPSTFYPSGA